MQTMFDFGDRVKLAQMRDGLLSAFGRPRIAPTRDPTSELVKAMISGRTKDTVSLPAYERLKRAYPRWASLAAAPPREIETVISDVTFADVKAGYLSQTMQIIGRSHPDFRLEFLGRCSVPRALGWLERLPGVGRKVAASTLNFSNLHRPALVIDTHVLRVLRRFGFVPPKATTQKAYGLVMAAADGWSATALAELHCLAKHLGQSFCPYEQPSCAGCPIRSRCATGIRLIDNDDISIVRTNHELF